MGPNVRQLAIYSQSVYENSMIHYFEDEFKKQESVQKIKFFLISTGFILLASAAVVIPLILSQFLRYLFI